MSDFSYAFRRIVDAFTRLRSLGYGLVFAGIGLLGLLVVGFTVNLAVPTPQGPLRFTLDTGAGLPAFLTSGIGFLGGLLILVGLARLQQEWRLADRRRVFVIEVRGLRDWNGPPLVSSVPVRILGRREEITLSTRGQTDGAVDSPEAAIKKIEPLRAHVEVREQTLDRDNIAYVFAAIAPVPLTFLAGVILDDEMPVTFMDWDRHRKVWRELEDADDGARFAITGVDSVQQGAASAILAISASYGVNLAGAQAKQPGLPLVHLDLAGASTTSNLSETKQEQLSQQFIDTVMSLERKGVKEIHLFFAGPNSLVARFGSHWDKRNFPQVVVYQYEQQLSPPFPWGVRMPVGGVAEPQVERA